MNVQQQINQLITHRAAEWFELLRNGKAKDNPEFIRWIGESPRHMKEFMAILAMNEELPGAFARAGIDRDALLKRVSSKVTQLPAASGAIHARVSKGTFGWMKIAAAAVLVAALGMALWIAIGQRGLEYSTAVGEQRTVTLADGSVLYLNADSTVKVRMAASSRDIQLLQGEALFQVARDAQRPFRVRTRDTVVQAVGTQFNVNDRRTRTIVSVLEGKVEVSGELLNAGEAAEVSLEGTLQRHPGVNVADAVAWRQRQLVFAKTSLEDVVADFNRFHRRGRMVLEGVEPGTHHYTGTFDADDAASFAALLAREEDLTVEQRNGDYVIRAMRPAESSTSGK